MTTAHCIRSSLLAAAAALALALSGVVLTPAPASATIFTVTSSLDTGAGSLRELIGASSPEDTITFHPSVTSIALTSGPIVIPHSLQIIGPGSSDLAITSVLGALHVQPGFPGQDFAVSGVRFVAGSVLAEHAIQVSSGAFAVRNVTLRDVVVEGFTGGGVSAYPVDGSLEVTDSMFRFNSSGIASAGGLSSSFVGGTVTIRDTVFFQNQSANVGGGLGLMNVAGQTSLERVTFNENTATALGGALYLQNIAGVTVTDSVFLGNSVTNGTGGGIGVRDVIAPLTIAGSTFVGNTAQTPGPATLLGSAISTQSASAAITLLASSVLGNTVTGHADAVGAIVVEEVAGGGSLLVDSSTIADSAVVSQTLPFAALGLTISQVGAGGSVDIVNSTLREVSGFDPGATGYGLVTSLLVGDLDISHSTLVATVSVAVFGLGLVPSAQIDSSILARSAVLPDSSDVPNVQSLPGVFDIAHSVLTGGSFTGLYNDLGGNQFRVDPLLGALQNNGGPTFTMLPQAGSPAIDRGTPGAVVPVYDQRGPGFDRVLAGRVDAGAVETPGVAPAALPVMGQTIPLWIPIVAGVLVLLGIAAVVINVLRRRGAK